MAGYMASPPRRPHRREDEEDNFFDEVIQVRHGGRTYTITAHFMGRRTDRLPQRMNDLFPRFIAAIGANETTEKMELTPYRARRIDYASFHRDLDQEQHEGLLTQSNAFGAEGLTFIEAKITGERPAEDVRTISGWLKGRDGLEATLLEFRRMPAGDIAHLNAADAELRAAGHDLSIYFDSMQEDLAKLVWHVGSIHGIAPFVLCQHAKEAANPSLDIDEAMYFVGLDIYRTLTQHYLMTYGTPHAPPLQLNEAKMRYLSAVVGRGQGNDMIWRALGQNPAPVNNYSIEVIQGRRCRIDIVHIMRRHTAVHFTTNELLGASVQKTSFWPVQFNAQDVYRLLYHALNHYFIQAQGPVIGQQPLNKFIPFTLAVNEGVFTAWICFQPAGPDYDVCVASFFPSAGPGIFEASTAVINSIAAGYNRMINRLRALPDYS